MSDALQSSQVVVCGSGQLKDVSRRPDAPPPHHIRALPLHEALVLYRGASQCFERYTVQDWCSWEFIRSSGAAVPSEAVVDFHIVRFHAWCARQFIRELMVDARPPLQSHI